MPCGLRDLNAMDTLERTDPESRYLQEISLISSLIITLIAIQTSKFFSHHLVVSAFTWLINHISSTTLDIIVNMQNQALGCLK